MKIFIFEGECVGDFLKYFVGGNLYPTMSWLSQQLDGTRFYVFNGVLRERMES